MCSNRSSGCLWRSTLSYSPYRGQSCALSIEKDPSSSTVILAVSANAHDANMGSHCMLSSNFSLCGDTSSIPVLTNIEAPCLRYRSPIASTCCSTIAREYELSPSRCMLRIEGDSRPLCGKSMLGCLISTTLPSITELPPR